MVFLAMSCIKTHRAYIYSLLYSNNWFWARSPECRNRKGQAANGRVSEGARAVCDCNSTALQRHSMHMCVCCRPVPVLGWTDGALGASERASHFSSRPSISLTAPIDDVHSQKMDARPTAKHTPFIDPRHAAFVGLKFTPNLALSARISRFLAPLLPANSATHNWHFFDTRYALSLARFFHGNMVPPPPPLCADIFCSAVAGGMDFWASAVIFLPLSFSVDVWLDQSFLSVMKRMRIGEMQIYAERRAARGEFLRNASQSRRCQSRVCDSLMGASRKMIIWITVISWASKMVIFYCRFESQ